MNFKDMLIDSLKSCGEYATEPFLLYSAICDRVGDDYLLKQDASAFYELDREYRIVKEIAEKGEPKTIGRLLALCREQTSLPLRVYLHWIFDIFVFYYRINHVDGVNNAVLQSLRLDLLGDEDGLLSNDKGKDKRNLDAPKHVPLPQSLPTIVNSPSPAPRQTPKPKHKLKLKSKQNAKGSPDPNVPMWWGGHNFNTPIWQKNVVPPQIDYAQIKVIPARAGMAPTIAGTSPLKPYAVPNAIYKTLPDDALVYIASTRHIHVSAQCPCLKYSAIVRKGEYERARYNDFYRMYGFCDDILAKHHVPPLCNTCGNFVPEIPNKPIRQFLPL